MRMSQAARNWGRAFQAEGRAIAKALKWEGQDTERRAVWLEQHKQGMMQNETAEKGNR